MTAKIQGRQQREGHVGSAAPARVERARREARPRLTVVASSVVAVASVVTFEGRFFSGRRFGAKESERAVLVGMLSAVFTAFLCSACHAFLTRAPRRHCCPVLTTSTVAAAAATVAIAATTVAAAAVAATAVAAAAVAAATAKAATAAAATATAAAAARDFDADALAAENVFAVKLLHRVLEVECALSRGERSQGENGGSEEGGGGTQPPEGPWPLRRANLGIVNVVEADKGKARGLACHPDALHSRRSGGWVGGWGSGWGGVGGLGVQFGVKINTHN